MKIYSSIFRRLNGLEEVTEDRSPMVIRQRVAGVDAWEMLVQQDPHYGQTRTMQEWLDMAESRGCDFPFIVISAVDN